MHKCPHCGDSDHNIHEGLTVVCNRCGSRFTCPQDEVKVVEKDKPKADDKD